MSFQFSFVLVVLRTIFPQGSLTTEHAEYLAVFEEPVVWFLTSGPGKSVCYSGNLFWFFRPNRTLLLSKALLRREGIYSLYVRNTVHLTPVC